MNKQLPPGTYTAKVASVNEVDGKFSVDLEIRDYQREAVKGSAGGGKTVVIDKLLEGFEHQTPVMIRQHVQFFGRVHRKSPPQNIKNSKVDRKLAKLDYELEKIKANLEMECGYAYNRFKASLLINPGSLSLATNGMVGGINWYAELLHDLGYTPAQLKLPKSRGR